MISTKHRPGCHVWRQHIRVRPRNRAVLELLNLFINLPEMRYWNYTWQRKWSTYKYVYIYTVVILYPISLVWRYTGAKWHISSATRLDIKNVLYQISALIPFMEESPGHYDDVIMDSIASQITSLTIVYLTVHSGTDQRKHQSSASLAFVWEIHRWPVNFPHKWPVTRKMFPFDDVIMWPMDSSDEVPVMVNVYQCHDAILFRNMGTWVMMNWLYFAEYWDVITYPCSGHMLLTYKSHN